MPCSPRPRGAEHTLPTGLSKAGLSKAGLLPPAPLLLPRPFIALRRTKRSILPCAAHDLHGSRARTPHRWHLWGPDSKPGTERRARSSITSYRAGRRRRRRPGELHHASAVRTLPACKGRGAAEGSGRRWPPFPASVGGRGAGCREGLSKVLLPGKPGCLRSLRRE